MPTVPVSAVPESPDIAVPLPLPVAFPGGLPIFLPLAVYPVVVLAVVLLLVLPVVLPAPVSPPASPPVPPSACGRLGPHLPLPLAPLPHPAEAHVPVAGHDSSFDVSAGVPPDVAADIPVVAGKENSDNDPPGAPDGVAVGSIPICITE